ncbi:MAG TPA: preQ(1) synthase [Planctomycetota bacterium]|nr:preQ(1) synthase [Planctomycetota bacterium]
MARTYRSCAEAGLDAKLPRIETWESQFPKTTITIVDPEYNAICPKTNLPDFGTLTIQYEPDRRCLELKSFKMYMTAYRHVGIFYENAVNRILRDLVRACEPVWMTVRGEFNARGGIRTVVEVRHDRAE